MQSKYELSTLALEDVNEIWKYTKTQWSESQADKYFKDIFEEIDSICKNPKIGESISEVKKEHRILKVQSHFKVYKIKNELIYIDRILHHKMDIENTL